jgi:DNA-directed RNA polymerase subunit M/transcription elongation factor TFIIS
MDVRCKTCDKLFRVPDEKISGKGIKFSCTRCGDYVVISKEEVEQDAFAKTSAAVSGQSEPTPTLNQKPLVAEQEMPTQKPTEAPRSAAIEIRCENCSKLFRVPQEKIAGKGIRFSCTRCGEYVIVTKDGSSETTQFNTPVLDPDQPAPKPAYTEEPKKPTPAETTYGADTEYAYAQPPVQAPKVDLEFLPPQTRHVDPSAPQEQTPDNFYAAVAETHASVSDTFEALPREKPLSFDEFPSTPEPAGDAQPQFAAELGALLAEVMKPEADFVSEPVSKEESRTAVEWKPPVEQADESETEFSRTPLSFEQPVQESEPSPQPDPEPEPKLEPQPESESAAEPFREAFEASRTQPEPEPPREEEIVIQDAAPVAQKRVEIKAAPVVPFNWFDKVLLPIMAIIILGASGYGLFSFHEASMKKEMRSASERLTLEGLLITNVTNSKDSQGDLLIIGTVQNSSDKVKNAWYVVIDVYNAQGAEIDKLRLLNGKQLYSRRDYEILAKRGVNVQELKAKNLEEQGVLIPAQGSIEFTIRYVQPPDSVAGLKPALQTFDPVRLFREIAEDNK